MDFMIFLKSCVISCLFSELVMDTCLKHESPITNNNQNNKFTTWPTHQIIRKYNITIKVNKSFTFLTTPRILHTFLKHSNIDNSLHPRQQSKFYRQDALPPLPFPLLRFWRNKKPAYLDESLDFRRSVWGAFSFLEIAVVHAQ